MKDALFNNAFEKMLRNIEPDNMIFKDTIELEQDFNIIVNSLYFMGRNDYLWDSIDEIYNKDKWAYYKSFQSLKERSKTSLYQKFSYKEEDHAIKMLSIFENCKENDDYTLIFNLAKKGYKFSFNYCKKSDMTIDVDHFFYSWSHKYFDSCKGLDNIKMIESFYLLSLFIMINEENKKFCFSERAIGVLIDYNDYIYQSVHYEKFIEDLFSKSKQRSIWNEEFNKLLKISKLDKLFRQQKLLSVSTVIDNILGLEYKSSDNSFNNLLKDNPDGFTSANETISSSFRVSGLQSDILYRVNIDLNDFKTIYESIKWREDNGYASKKSFNMGLIASLISYGIGKLYKELKEVVLNDSQQELYYLTLEKEKVLKEKEDSYNQIIISKNTSISKLEKEKEQLQLKNAELLKELEKMKKEREILEDDSQELIALREFAYNSVSDELNDESASNSTPDYKMLLKDVKIAIFGGYPRWIQRLKEYIPHGIFISVDSINLDFSFLNSVDIVAINTSYLSHGLYYKLINYLKDLDIKIVYLDASNAKRSIEKIYGKY